MTHGDPHKQIVMLAKRQACLDVRTTDLCFLAALHLRAECTASTSFDEDSLVDIFEQVCDAVEPEAENPRKRATHSIQRLRDQRMLARVDGFGVSQAGEYTLTALAAGIVAYFLADEVLTRESLTILTGTLSAQLAEVLAAARRADSPESWRARVVVPLGVTVGDLIKGIERRQRGLDAQQEATQTEIADVLQNEWSVAIDRCQSLLDTMTTTLKELADVLLRDRSQLLALLQEVQNAAAAAGATEAEEAAQRVIEHVDRIAAWGAARQDVWSEYYQYVHRYLRDVVRLDPGRALSQRLRDQIAGWTKLPFALVVAAAPSIRLLRPLEARVERPPVTRPRADREEVPVDVVAADTLAELDARVRASLLEGASSLVAVTESVLRAVPREAHYAVAGHVAQSVARAARVRCGRERPWTTAADRLEIQDWSISKEGDPS